MVHNSLAGDVAPGKEAVFVGGGNRQARIARQRYPGIAIPETFCSPLPINPPFQLHHGGKRDGYRVSTVGIWSRDPETRLLPSTAYGQCESCH